MIRLIISKTRFAAKPTDKGAIVGLQKPANYEFIAVDNIAEVAALIGEGRAWRAGLYKKETDSFKRDNVVAAQIIALDFDSCPEAPETIIRYAESIGIGPSAWYYSYSQGRKEGYNFRILWVLEDVIKPIQFNTIYPYLLEQFGQYNPDKSTKDASRLWFGTASGVNVLNNKPLSLSRLGWLGVCEKLKQGQTTQKAKKAVKACESDFFAEENPDIEPLYITRGFDWRAELEGKCWLWDMWQSGRYLNYNQRLTLFTNLKYLRYADSNFTVVSQVLEIYEQHKAVYEGHTCNEEQIRSMFKNTTLYALGIVNDESEDESITVKDYLKKGKHEVINTLEKITLSELDTMLDAEMPRLLDAGGIVYIKAQPACGKTHRVIQWLLRQDLTQKKIIYSAPRYNLINEFEERYRQAYAEYHAGEPLNDDIDIIHIVPRGNYSKADELLMELGFPAQTRQEERFLAIQEMINPEKKGLYVATHQCITHLRTCPADCIIIDENIEGCLLDETKLNTTILNGLVSCMKDEYKAEARAFIDSIDDMTRGDTIDLEVMRRAMVDGFDWYKYISNIKRGGGSYAGVARLTEAHAEPPKIAIEGGSNVIRFTIRSNLITDAMERGTAIKMLSATPKPARLNAIYGLTENGIETYNFPLAKNTGTIIQYLGITGAKGSRGTTDDDNTMKMIKYVKRKLPEEVIAQAYVLTFKDAIKIWMEEGFNIPFYNGEAIHIANNSGMDLLKGKTVIVAGKFDESTDAYENIYYDLHPEATEPPRRGMVDVETANRKRKVYLFLDPELNKIQQETIKLYLEQSAGRARALREEGAKVYLFANYPIEDADIYYDN